MFKLSVTTVYFTSSRNRHQRYTFYSRLDKCIPHRDFIDSLKIGRLACHCLIHRFDNTYSKVQ